MRDFTRSFEIEIDASVHDVFQYCRNPRHLFEGWHELEVTEVVMTPEGVGTKALIVGRFAKGMMVEQIEREFTEFVPEKRIVSKAHGKVRFAGRTKEVANGPVFTWVLGVLLESVSAVVMSRSMRSMLSAIKTGAETQSSSAA